VDHKGREEQWDKAIEISPDCSLLERTRLWPFEKPDVVSLGYESLE